MNFYNQHNFDQFIKLYNDSVKVYTYPDKLLASGKSNIVSIFEPKFSSKSIQVKIISQINNGSYVINQEIVTENGMDTKYISIYEVKNGLITSVRFVRDYWFKYCLQGKFKKHLGKEVNVLGYPITTKPVHT